VAKTIIVAIDNPKKLYQVCDIIQQIVSTDKIIVKVHTQNESEIIQSLNIQNIIVENHITSNFIAKQILKEKV
jgi:CPA2 family monovalent cation:H+ antiporter-2